MFSGKYKKYDRSPKSIDLDYSNPRLIGYLKRESLSSQKDLIVALATHYAVMELCSSIVENGFHPDETLIVIPDETDKQNRVTALEGNRRLAACKILLQPSLLKGTSLYPAINRLVKSNKYDFALETIKRISVVEIDGRAEATAYIASKHTQESIRSWSVYTQGAYYLSFKTPKSTLADVREQLGKSVDLSKIRHRVLFYRLGEYILEMPCWSMEEKSHLVENIDALKVEAIIRLLGNSEFRNNVATINVDEYGELYCEGLPSNAFQALMEKLARSSHFSSDDPNEFTLSTRQENKEDVQGYIQSCVELVDTDNDESPKSRLYVQAGDSEGEIPENQSEVLEAGKKAKSTRKWKTLLDKDDITLPKSPPKLKVLVEEACKLRVNRSEHTAALLSRAILEITLKVWLKRNNMEGELKAKYKEKAFDFNSLLKFFESNTSKLITDDRDAQQALRSAVQGLLERDKEILNLTNHNDFHILTASELAEIKSKLELFSRYFFPRLT